MGMSIGRAGALTGFFAATLAVGLMPAASAQAGHTVRPAASSFTMPKVVGMVLQDAQDLLQSKGSYLMDQQDAKGWGRWQILDSGWKVCWQKPGPGVKVSTSAVIALGSVKLNEKCPR